MSMEELNRRIERFYKADEAHHKRKRYVLKARVTGLLSPHIEEWPEHMAEPMLRQIEEIGKAVGCEFVVSAVEPVDFGPEPDLPGMSAEGWESSGRYYVAVYVEETTEQERQDALAAVIATNH